MFVKMLFLKVLYIHTHNIYVLYDDDRTIFRFQNLKCVKYNIYIFCRCSSAWYLTLFTESMNFSGVSCGSINIPFVCRYHFQAKLIFLLEAYVYTYMRRNLEPSLSERSIIIHHIVMYNDVCAVSVS